MNPFEMVVLIVAISAGASMYRAKYGIVRRGRGRHATEEFVGSGRGDNAQHLEEIKALKERIAVLERITTETNSAVSLDREIEKLR